MNRLLKVTLATVLSSLVGLLTLSGYYLYVKTQERTAEFEATLQRLKGISHPQWEVNYELVRIRTSDSPVDTSRYFRLLYGSSDVQKFHDKIAKASGHIVTAWVSDWRPRSEISKFDELAISHSGGGTSFDVAAKVRPGESVSIEIVITFILEENK